MLKQDIILPPKTINGNNEVWSCCKPLVIIGANGSGKSRFGFWMEQNQAKTEKVHRISAQRILNFDEYAKLKSLEQAEKEFLFGTSQDFKNWGGPLQAKIFNRWQNHNKPTLSVTTSLNDYESLLSLLFAKRAQRDSQLAKLVKKMKSEGRNELPQMPDSPDEVLLRIWNDIFPHRNLVIEDGRITVLAQKGFTYQGSEMSDGERVALYLMAQCLCVPPDSVVIIDEPEIHFHRALLSRLWSKIEEAQPNCLFVYITQDVDLAASRVGSRKIWIKQYDGLNWTWDEVLEDEGLPETVLLEILGSRKKVLFVEGEKGSLDYEIYQAIYPDFLIVPRGSYSKVIESTKAMRNNPSLHHVEAFGLIDVDYRSLEEIASLKESSIFALNVAEVENMFCVKEVLDVVARCLAKDVQETYQKVSEFVIKLFAENLEDQVSKRSISEIEFKLNMFDTKARGKAQLSQALISLTNSIKTDEIYDKNLDLYQEVIKKNDYEKALFLYNNKGLSKMISRYLELQSEGYRNFVLRLLSTEYKNDIVSGLKKYAPVVG